MNMIVVDREYEKKVEITLQHFYWFSKRLNYGLQRKALKNSSNMYFKTETPWRKKRELLHDIYIHITLNRQHLSETNYSVRQ